MKIAIYGGAFNPVHNEHINIALAAKCELGLDKVIIVPSNKSLHKLSTLTVRAKDRLEMCRLAFEKYEGFEVSDCEIKRGGITFSYVTCRRFKKLYPDAELYFIMGADQLKSFADWKEPEEILKCVTPAVCAREDSAELIKYIKNFSARFKRDIVTFKYVGKAVSSTRIRTLAALGEDIAEFVPQDIKNLIRSRKLYALPEVWGVKKLLTEERWQHTVRVTLFAAKNAARAHVYEYDAILAAALHDCAKYLGESSPELNGFECPAGVPAPVIHQYAGAYVAEHIFGITDKYVLNAIRYHTSGRENMGDLEKLIFLADLLEEGRDFEGVENLRKIFLKDIDECMLAALGHQLEYLEKQKKPVYPLTKRAYEYLKEQLI
ncbi:MAG: nicotinate (nicotinamide) nucleotide adenylyltransferase [Clostridiales bacterium]|nr:nicotinate (nicotinamide) nucleotide adenylyltransferase [Clostridiales bacterium]